MRYYTPTKSIGAAFPKLKRVKRKAKSWRSVNPASPTAISEAGLQSLCEEYLDACGLRWLHIPPAALYACAWGSKGSIVVKREIADYLKGTPDLMIFGPAIPGHPWVRALCVELKVGRNRQSAGQRRWGDNTTVNECRDIDIFKALVDSFVKNCCAASNL